MDNESSANPKMSRRSLDVVMARNLKVERPGRHRMVPIGSDRRWAPRLSIGVGNLLEFWKIGFS
jgi:hypothetical protein